jgi:hypothetical protein
MNPMHVVVVPAGRRGNEHGGDRGLTMGRGPGVPPDESRTLGRYISSASTMLSATACTRGLDAYIMISTRQAKSQSTDALKIGPWLSNHALSSPAERRKGGELQSAISCERILFFYDTFKFSVNANCRAGATVTPWRRRRMITRRPCRERRRGRRR